MINSNKSEHSIRNRKMVKGIRDFDLRNYYLLSIHYYLNLKGFIPIC